ncbi:MAG TPA: thiamine phosphate synthase, partial [Thermomicrobiaceae bacterium]|nr:thiamine phosphate synthase [Thermomicrobiaceae bacterium]
CRERGVLFVVNDRVDLALALGADGIHVGVDDLPLRETRALVGNRMVVGYSPPTLSAALAAVEDGADYLGIGPVYATSTKGDAGVPVGVEQVARVTAEVGLPVVGIGGIGAAGAGAVVEAGAAGVAVISAVVGADDVRAAAREIRVEVDRALRARR